jgi:hypothetical protein
MFFASSIFLGKQSLTCERSSEGLAYIRVIVAILFTLFVAIIGICLVGIKAKSSQIVFYIGSFFKFLHRVTSTL